MRVRALRRRWAATVEDLGVDDNGGRRHLLSGREQRQANYASEGSLPPQGIALTTDLHKPREVSRKAAANVEAAAESGI